MALIREHGGQKARDLLEFADLLATITLDHLAIKRIVEEEEANMMTLEEKNRALEQIAEFFGETASMRSVRQQGREEGREEFLAALLRERFGEQPALATTAHRLAAWPGAASAVHAISAAGRLDDVPPTAPTA